MVEAARTRSGELRLTVGAAPRQRVGFLVEEEEGRHQPASGAQHAGRLAEEGVRLRGAQVGEHRYGERELELVVGVGKAEVRRGTTAARVVPRVVEVDVGEAEARMARRDPAPAPLD